MSDEEDEIKDMVNNLIESTSKGEYEEPIEDFKDLPVSDQLYHIRGSIYVLYQEMNWMLTWMVKKNKLSAKEFAEIATRLAHMNSILEINFPEFLEDEEDDSDPQI